MIDLSFYKGKKVLVTGHTGFKGAWLCKLLLWAGADVTGYALKPPTTPNLYDMAGLTAVHSIIGDVRDLAYMQQVFSEVQPQFVIHMAAQPIVRESYKNPVLTYETNVMGTVHVLECIRKTQSVVSFLNVTTDKVYENQECQRGYKETDMLGGFDPYSNSKACSELVTGSYTRSFFADRNLSVSTARAGNVIGGGDFAKDRIIPDCVRAAMAGEDIVVRNPYAIRPFQHVLEPLIMYLTILAKQYEDPALAGNYNIGPEDRDCITTGELVTLFCQLWGNDLSWINQSDGGPHEAGLLKLDCSRIKQRFLWKNHWDIQKAVDKTVEWTKAYLNNEDISECMIRQIEAYI